MVYLPELKVAETGLVRKHDTLGGAPERADDLERSKPHTYFAIIFTGLKLKCQRADIGLTRNAKRVLTSSRDTPIDGDIVATLIHVLKHEISVLFPPSEHT